ncbi:MAG: CvpA family protein [Candidatus Jacksonbacteria bacterium]|jgi:uncharacterized membrane protein required for colicin V production|nr:CvpA family protein [Candidatus Jacksonbacteria bacterium]MBT6034350.1 CvpA family protein [Candidatus Jacksonbacteria bacterium]MBT6301318.1 CvpA family protein [Candidatus Jacksonbacteria bacterium]MBT6757761.1 CvpA family protein [Candidatus Jacksonbacteria bacterium]MBT6955386.1 CvpA family protein [Candidatus Jacksonbacteria bacterium]
MSYFDAILVVGLIFAWSYGWNKGFIKSLGSFIAIVVGVIIASWFHVPAAELIGGETFSLVFSFAVIFIIVNRLIILLAIVLDKIWQLFRIIPLTRFVNKFLGGILWGLSFVVFVGIGFPVIIRLITDPTVLAQIEKSLVLELIFASTGFLLPFVPEYIKETVYKVYLI